MREGHRQYEIPKKLAKKKEEHSLSVTCLGGQRWSRRGGYGGWGGGS